MMKIEERRRRPTNTLATGKWQSPNEWYFLSAPQPNNSQEKYRPRCENIAIHQRDTRLVCGFGSQADEASKERDLVARSIDR